MLGHNILTDTVPNTGLSTANRQKNKIIEILESQIKQYNCLRIDYIRIKDHRDDMNEKCQQISTQIAKLNENNDHRYSLQTNQQTQLKKLLNKLENQLKTQQNLLEQLKQQKQAIINLSQNRQYEQLHKIQEIQIHKQQLQNNKQTYQKMQQKVLKINTQLNTIKTNQKSIKKATQQIKNNQTQIKSYLRNLHLQEDKLNYSVQMQQKKNDQAYQRIQYIQKYQQISELEKKKLEQQNQNQICGIETMKIKLGRIHRQIEQKKKLYKQQIEKQKNIKKKLQIKNSQKSKLESVLADVQSWNTKIGEQNTQILDINEKISNDLIMCRKHQQNLQQNNNYLNKQLEQFSAQNYMIIKKLQTIQHKQNNNPEALSKNWLSQTQATTYGKFYSSNDEYKYNSKQNYDYLH